MTKIPGTFVKYREVFTLVKRIGNVCMFKRERQDGKSRQWEVMKIRQKPERVIDGKTIPAREALPSASEWGKLGKTFMDTPTDRQRAEERYQQWVTESEAQLATA